MNRIDKLIDLNLRILYEAPRHNIMTVEIEDPDNEFSLSNYEARVIADYLVDKGLMTLYIEECHITPYGLEISELGGWKIYKELQAKKSSEESVKSNERSKLEEENLKLSIAIQNYEIANRENKREIDRLTKKNLKLNNLQLIYALIGIALGIIIKIVYNLIFFSEL